MCINTTWKKCYEFRPQTRPACYAQGIGAAAKPLRNEWREWSNGGSEADGTRKNGVAILVTSLQANSR